jgi:hypothetical protein
MFSIPFKVASQPIRQGVFTEIALGQRERGRDAIGIIGDQNPSIQVEKQLHGHECGALVPVGKRMVAGDPEGTRRQ